MSKKKLIVEVHPVVKMETNDMRGKRLELKFTEGGNYSIYSENSMAMVWLTEEEMDTLVNQMYPTVKAALEVGREDSR